MRRYNQKILLKIIVNSLIIVIMIIMSFHLYNDKTRETFAIAFSILVLFASIIIISVLITDYKKNSIALNDEYILFNKPKGLFPVETRLNWTDIKIIRCYGKIKYTKEIYISTRFNSISIKISRYKHYKEVVKTIVEKTSQNTNITINEDVYDLIE